MNTLIQSTIFQLLLLCVIAGLVIQYIWAILGLVDDFNREVEYRQYKTRWELVWAFMPLSPLIAFLQKVIKHWKSY